MVRVMILVAIFITANLSSLTTFGQSAQGSSENRIKVSRKDFGDKWPLTVDSGEIECISGVLLVFHSGNKTYALNGAAQSQGYPKIDPIWTDNPKLPGTKMNIGPLLEVGKKLLK